MRYRALNSVTARAIGVRSTFYSVHVGGDGCVVPTTKSGKMDPIFACEVLFALCVYGRGDGPQECVR